MLQPHPRNPQQLRPSPLNAAGAQCMLRCSNVLFCNHRGSAQALCQYLDLLIKGFRGDARGGVVERVEHHLQHTAHKNDCETEQNVCVPAPVETWLSVLNNDLLIA
jgi:hypothetical protein